jgi:hypothetical protein
MGGIEYGSIKHKLMIAVLLAGEYPYKSLDLMKESPERKREAVYQLKDKGYIDVKIIGAKRKKTYANQKQHKVIRLKMFSKRKYDYVYDLFDGADNYEPDIRTDGITRLERKDRLAELIMVMLESGVNVTPDLKPSPEHPGPLDEYEDCLPYFISSIEARAAITIKEDKGKGARFHGTLISAGGIYNIYNMGSVMMEWVRPSEKTAVDFNSQYEKRMTPWGKDSSEWYSKSAIIFSRKMDFIIDFVIEGISPRKGYNPNKNLANINNYYDHTFYLPLSLQGEILLNMMTRKKWHYYLVGMFYKDEHLAGESVKYSIACDAVKDGCYGLVFLDCDIGRLKRFTSIKVKPEHKGKYKIICYDFQEEIVKALAPEGMDIVVMPFDAVINAFYQIYEKLEESGKEL